MFKKGDRGFTLVELLVVIAIIGLLAVIVLVSFNLTRAKSRDAQRVAEIKNLKLALGLYDNDYGQYVVAGDCDADSWIVINGASDAVSTALIGMGLFSAGSAPRDPMSPSQEYEYCYLASTDSYQFRYVLEVNSSAGLEGVHVIGP